MRLGVEEFLRRWVQHVLPGGFVKIRHYGLLANRGRAERLALCGDPVDNNYINRWAFWWDSPGGSWQTCYANTKAGQPIGPASMFQAGVTRPTSSATCSNLRPSSAHSGVMMVALCDASVRGLTSGMSATTWWAANTRDGHEAPGSDW